jgi:hypothetical protein
VSECFHPISHSSTSLPPSTNCTSVAIGTQQLQLKSKPNRAEHNSYQFASFFQFTTDFIKFQIATKSKGSFIGADDFLDKTTQK